jgi:CheY-like chemotaxis protein
MKRVFVIDRDPGFIDKIRHALHTDELELLAFQEIETGLSRAKTDNPDLIILGFNEETLDHAFDIARNIKDFHAEKHLPVLLAGTTQAFRGYKFNPADSKNYRPVDDFIEKDAAEALLSHKLHLLFNTDNSFIRENVK